MLSKPHRKFCEGIVSGLTGVRAYSLAYPRCSFKTARFNASHLRAKPQIQDEIARLRDQADAIAGPVVLTLIEKRRWLARVVRANLARLDPEIDGDLLVSLHVEEGRKKPRFRKIRIADKLLAIKLDTQLAGDETATSAAEDPIAALIKRVTEKPWPPVPPATPKTSPNTQTEEDSHASQPPASSNVSADSQVSADPQGSANSEGSAAYPDSPPEYPDSAFDPRPSSFDPSASSPATGHEPPITSPPPLVFPPPRPRFYPGPDFASRHSRPTPRRHAWEEC